MIGSNISHYKVEAELGRGGMGVVYRALDTKLDRTVALKFLPPMIGADPDIEARFVNEAKAVSKLDHPNIAVVHEIDRTDDGQLFIVMAFYDGVTLEDRIADGDLTTDEIVDLCTDIASGLTRAHDTGIIHRDIKPANVMITKHGDLKILDFGLAKIQNVTLTMGAQSLGTLAYMSPEQAQGQPVDHRTDLWALGVVMYEMFAGRRPFDGPYDAAILYAAANEDPEPISSIVADLPPYLADLIAALLQKQPDRRVQSAAEVVATLKQKQAPTESQIQSVHAVAAPDSTETAPSAEAIGTASTTPTSATTSSPRSVTITLDPSPIVQKPWILISLVVIVTAMALTWMFGFPSGDGTSDADREAARTHIEAGFALQQERRYSEAEAEYERAIERDDELWSAWTSYASLKNELGEYEEAIEYARTAISLNDQDAVAYFNLGIALEDSGNRSEALSAFEDAVLIDGKFTAAFSAWGNTLVRDGQLDEAIRVLEAGREASPNDPNIFLIFRNLGIAYAGLGQNDDAILYLDSSTRLVDGQPVVWAELGRLYEETGDVQKALEAWGRYVNIETDPIKVRDANASIERLRQ